MDWLNLKVLARISKILRTAFAVRGAQLFKDANLKSVPWHIHALCILASALAAVIAQCLLFIALGLDPLQPTTDNGSRGSSTILNSLLRVFNSGGISFSNIDIQSILLVLGFLVVAIPLLAWRSTYSMRSPQYLGVECVSRPDKFKLALAELSGDLLEYAIVLLGTTAIVCLGAWTVPRWTYPWDDRVAIVFWILPILAQGFWSALKHPEEQRRSSFIGATCGILITFGVGLLAIGNFERTKPYINLYPSDRCAAGVAERCISSIYLRRLDFAEIDDRATVQILYTGADKLPKQIVLHSNIERAGATTLPVVLTENHLEFVQFVPTKDSCSLLSTARGDLELTAQVTLAITGEVREPVERLVPLSTTVRPAYLLIRGLNAACGIQTQK